MGNNVGMAQRYEHEIPEGYEVRIDGNKVIMTKKDSEDERIRKSLVNYFTNYLKNPAKMYLYPEVWEGMRVRDILAYFERQKDKVVEFDRDREQKPNPYSGTGFDYNGHHWGMCARDGGVEITVDGKISGKIIDRVLFESESIERSDSVAKEMFIKALERAVEQTKKGYELTDCDKHSWWEDFKAYSEIKHEELSEDEKARKGLWKYFHDWQYSPLCHTIKDKIREYIANHFIADTVVKTDMKDIVKAMEEGVRLGMEEQKSAEMRDSRQIALMIDNGRRSGVIEGRKQVVDNPEEYGLCKPSEWSEEDENHFKHILNVLEDVQGKQMEKGFNNLNSDICWFESLRLRAKPHWKPSKVQIDILWDALSNLRHDGYKHMEELESLYNDIKKL